MVKVARHRSAKAAIPVQVGTEPQACVVNSFRGTHADRSKIQGCSPLTRVNGYRVWWLSPLANLKPDQLV